MKLIAIIFTINNHALHKRSKIPRVIKNYIIQFSGSRAIFKLGAVRELNGRLKGKFFYSLRVLNSNRKKTAGFFFQ